MTPAGKQTTHFADNVFMEPVVSISPARNSWYLVHAMMDEGSGRSQSTGTELLFVFCLETRAVVQQRSAGSPPMSVNAPWQLSGVSWPLRQHGAAFTFCRKSPNRSETRRAASSGPSTNHINRYVYHKYKCVCKIRPLVLFLNEDKGTFVEL